MHERHENEQYFFDDPTLDTLSSFLLAFETPCCICAPRLGQRLIERGGSPKILDIDTRFEHLPGFRLFDLQRPRWLGERYDIIVCDPPFYNVSLSRLFAALRLLSRNTFTQPLMLSYLSRRSQAILGTFAPFGLAPSGYRPSYQTVQRSERNEIEFFTNLGDDQLEILRGVG